MVALPVTCLLRILICTHTERIDDFHLKFSHTEKELCEGFLETEEPEILQEMKQYFAQAKALRGDQDRSESKETILH